MVAQQPDRARIWTDTELYSNLGTPRNEEIEIDLMINAAKLFCAYRAGMHAGEKLT